MKNNNGKMTLLASIMIASCVCSYADIELDENIVTEQPYTTQEQILNVRDTIDKTDLSELKKQVTVSADQEMIEKAQNLNLTVDETRLNGEQRASVSRAESKAKEDDDDCAIWLCLPNSFPKAAGCAIALSQFHKRIRRHKSPLPSYSSCNKGGINDNMSYSDGVAAFIPAHTEKKCLEYAKTYGEYATRNSSCVRYQVDQIPEHYVHGTPCIHGINGTTTPNGCTKTRKFVTVNDNGQKYGDTYYYDD